MLAAWLSKRVMISKSPLVASALLGWLSVFILYNRWGLEHRLAVSDFVVGTAMVPLLVLGVQHPAVVWLLSWRPLVFLGTFSYSIYLVHAPLLILIDHEVIARLHWQGTYAFVVFLLLLPSVLALAYGFFWFAERPFLRAGKSGKKNRRDCRTYPGQGIVPLFQHPR